jgi:uncharacterized protein (TIGR03437 family)
MISDKIDFPHRRSQVTTICAMLGIFLFTCSEPEAAKPVASAIAPAEEEVGGEVLIIGSNLASATSVTFGSTTSSIVGKTDTELLTIVPPGLSAGPTEVTVIGPGGKSNSLTFNVLPTVPFDPATHPVIEEVVASQNITGELLLLRGSNFSTASTVKFGAVEAEILTATSKVIAVIIPASLSVGSYAVKVKNAIGTSEGKPFAVTATQPPQPAGLTLTSGISVASLPPLYVPPISNFWTNTTAPAEGIQLNDESGGKLSAFLPGEGFPDEPNGSYDRDNNWVEFTVAGVRYFGVWTTPTEKNELGVYCMNHMVLISTQSGWQLELQVKNIDCE